MEVRADKRTGKLGVLAIVTLTSVGLETSIVLTLTLWTAWKNLFVFLLPFLRAITPVVIQTPELRSRVKVIVLVTLLQLKPFVWSCNLQVLLLTQMVLVLQRTVAPNPLNALFGVKILGPPATACTRAHISPSLALKH